MHGGRSTIAWLACVALASSWVVAATASAGAPPSVSFGGSSQHSFGPETFSAIASAPRYIVRVRDGDALQALSSRLDAIGSAPLTRWSAMSALVVDLRPSALQALQSDAAVLSIEPDPPIYAVGSQTSPPWGLDRVDQHSQPLDGVYDYTSTGAGVTAYVIDSGLRFTHQEFTNRVPRSAFWNFGDGTGANDCDGHGTHVAGTLGGSTYGVAKEVSIIPVKVLDCTGAGSGSSLIGGINWVIADHATGVPAVANLSLGGPPSAAVDAAVQALIADGVTVVVAAGNSDTPTCGESPARVAGAITVAASDEGDARATFSNTGACNDLFAPGTNVLSAFIGADTATAVESGTSMATPHVAGAAALLLQNHPQASPDQITAMLLANATTGVLTGLAPGDPDKLLFAAREYQLTVTRTGTGVGTVRNETATIDCGATCTAPVFASATVALTATPTPGSTFVGWSGGCSGTTPCSVTVNAPTQVTAEFGILPVNVAAGATQPARRIGPAPP